MVKQRKKTFSYWTRKDGSRWRSVKEFEQVKGFKKLVAVRKTTSRRIQPKKRKSYWRTRKKRKLEHWVGFLKTDVLIIYAYSYSNNTRYATQRVQGKYKANSKAELYEKLEADAVYLFEKRFSADEYREVTILSIEVKQIYGDRPKLPSEWGF